MNTIATRIADFLKDFPPFNMLQKEECIAIAAAVEVFYVPKDEYVFKTGDSVQKHFYVVKDGAIGLYRSDPELLVDECDEGDIFGLRALMRQGNYELDARALEESVVYSISATLFETYITTNAKASTYLMTSFASNSRLFQNAETPVETATSTDIQSADYSKNPVTCVGTETIQTAALRMREKHVGSIVVVEDFKPIGIITDKDLRMQIATGDVSIDAPVTKIMSSPVITYPEDISVAEAQIAMIKNRITHLCITRDGTPDSKLTGILSEHDIIVLREHTASSLIKEIKRASSAETCRNIRMRAQELLQRYLEQEIPITFIAKIISAINDAITKKVIDLILAKQEHEPPVSFAWMTIGSQGRNEQLLMTDQDNALVFEDVPDSKYQVTKNYFLNLASQINQDLELVGFELCPAQMMASNPKWCLSVSEWQQQFKRWITTPDQDNLMLCTIFFDFECVYGNKQLVVDLAEDIFNTIESHDIFLTYLGRNALQNPPPLSFFRQFLVEQSGEHKDQFDIKARAMMPLVDAARLLILSHEIKSINNTVERYEKLAILEPQNKEVYLFCIEAFKDLLQFRTLEGIRDEDSGRFIDLKSLHKKDRLRLKRSFNAVKGIQELIRTRFKLSQLL